jgi:uncharacterized glyoxalase superfamily protein PhnB
MKSVPRSGYSTVTPRIVVADTAAFVTFVRAVFDATGDHHEDHPSEIRIGESLLLVSGDGVRDALPAFLYVYVDDADARYRRALAAGATSLEKPFDLPYGDRRAMVRDPSGTTWQIAHVIR